MGFAVKRCPFCAEEILAEAKRCTQCGENLFLAAVRLKLPSWKFIALLAVAVYFVGEDARKLLEKHMRRADLPGARAETKSTSTIELADVESVLKNLREKPHRIHDFGYLLPLESPDGKLTRLGTALSIMGMERAIYLPHMRLRGCINTVPEFFEDLGFFDPGGSITTRALSVVQTRAQGQPVIRGTLEVNDDSFEISLQLEGKPESRIPPGRWTRDTIHAAPQWIARGIHRLAGVSLSKEEEAYLDRSHLIDGRSLLHLAEMEPAHAQDGMRVGAVGYRDVLEKNPGCSFAALRLLRAIEWEAAAQPGEFDRLKERFGSHGAVAFELARRRIGNPALSVPAFLALLPTQHRTYRVHFNLVNELRAEGKGDVARRLLDDWIDREPMSAEAHTTRGDFYQSWAWDARGSGWANTVTGEGARLFQERIAKSESDLTVAFGMNPKDAYVCAQMITNCLASGRERAKMEAWFKAGLSADPLDYGLHDAKMTFLTPRWGGDPVDLLKFGRECATKVVRGSRIPLILHEAHLDLADMLHHSKRGTRAQYFRQDEVYRELKELFEACLAVDPTPEVLNRYVKTAFEANDYTTAHLLFQRIADRWSGRVWKSWEEYAQHRELAAINFKTMGPLYERHKIELTTAITKRLDPVHARNLSLFYSSFVNAEFHDAKKALRYAQDVNERCPDYPYFVDVLACAQARAGRFEEAVATQKRAIELFRASKDFDDVARSCSIPEFEARLASFEAKQAYQGEQ